MGFAGITNTHVLAGPFAGLAGLAGLGWLAPSCGSTRSSPRPAPA